MRVFIIGALVVGIVMVNAADKYTTKYDGINIEEILKSERLLKAYMGCLTGRGNCTPEGLELKNVIPEALETGCSKCSEKQLEGTKNVVDYLRKNKPDAWKELEAIFDPSGKYRTKYADFLQ